MRDSKTCADCSEVLPLTAFQRYWNNQRDRYCYMAYCKRCRSARRRGPQGDRERLASNLKRRAQYAADPLYRETVKERNRTYRFGVDSGWLEQRLAEQGGVCAICGTDEPQGRGWVVDHDHRCCDGIRTCGKCLRAVLCNPCNMALGLFRDDPGHLRAAAAYVEAFASQPVA